MAFMDLCRLASKHLKQAFCIYHIHTSISFIECYDEVMPFLLIVVNRYIIVTMETVVIKRKTKLQD